MRALIKTWKSAWKTLSLRERRNWKNSIEFFRLCKYIFHTLFRFSPSNFSSTSHLESRNFNSWKKQRERKRGKFYTSNDDCVAAYWMALEDFPPLSLFTTIEMSWDICWCWWYLSPIFAISLISHHWIFLVSFIFKCFQNHGDCLSGHEEFSSFFLLKWLKNDLI